MMETDRRIGMLWLLCERSPAGARLRRRLCACGGFAILLGGFLIAAGLGGIVKLVVAAAALGLIAAAGAAALPRVWRATRVSMRSGWIRRAGTGCARASRVLVRLSGSSLAWARAGASNAVRVSVPVARTGYGRASDALVRISGSTLARTRTGTSTAVRISIPAVRTTAAQVQRVRLPAFPEALAREVPKRLGGRREVLSWSRRQLERAPRLASRTTYATAAPAFRRARREREALRRNAEGVQLRRQGSYSEAAAEHRAALEILRALGDQRSVALTLNNLALTVSHDGDDTTAVALFEEAATILGELGDDQVEGQVMANLGLTHRRHGRSEEANNVLQLALTKLTPASTAYHQVEAELAARAEANTAACGGHVGSVGTKP